MEWTNTKNIGPIAYTAVLFDGQPLNIRADGCRVLWKPSVFQGNGSEKKVNICLSDVSDSIEYIRNLEKELGDNLISVIKDNHLKCKINLDTVCTYDSDNNRVECVDSWENLLINACIHIKGKWSSRNACGLQVQVTDIQILGKHERKNPFI